MKTTVLPSHLFVCTSDGALYDTRLANWETKPIRPNYRASHRHINSVADLKATLRNGPYTFPGCYPLYFITDDGCALSFETVRAEFGRIASSMREGSRDGWRVIGCDVNWEDDDLRCEHSGDKIESAYGDNE